MSETVGAIILAAGGATRLGRPKQFLQYRGISLIRRSVEAAIGAGCSPIIVVAGRDTDCIREELASTPAQVVCNADWELGIGVSIRIGVTTIISLSPDLAAVVLMVCDQPFVTSDTISTLISLREGNPDAIVASTYEGIQGVPALFDRQYIEELQRLPNSTGARLLFQKHSASVIESPFTEGRFDIDTEEDFRLLT